MKLPRAIWHKRSRSRAAHYWLPRARASCAVSQGGHADMLHVRRGDSGSQKVQDYLNVISHKIKIVGPTIEVKTKNSTDLSWVAATRSKSVEFFVFTSIVSELSSTGKASFHFHAALFGIRSQPITARFTVSKIQRATGLACYALYARENEGTPLSCAFGPFKAP